MGETGFAISNRTDEEKGMKVALDVPVAKQLRQPLDSYEVYSTTRY
jgi:hypothetical protein